MTASGLVLELTVCSGESKNVLHNHIRQLRGQRAVQFVGYIVTLALIGPNQPLWDMDCSFAAIHIHLTKYCGYLPKQFLAFLLYACQSESRQMTCGNPENCEFRMRKTRVQPVLVVVGPFDVPIASR